MSGALFNHFLFATLHLFYHRHSISMESLSSTENQRSAWNQVTSVVGTETSHSDAEPPVGLGSLRIQWSLQFTPKHFCNFPSAAGPLNR